MKEIYSLILQVLFLLIGLSLGILLLYYAIKSPRKEYKNDTRGVNSATEDIKQELQKTDV
jgi:hypothetical protein